MVVEARTLDGRVLRIADTLDGGSLSVTCALDGGLLRIARTLDDGLHRAACTLDGRVLRVVRCTNATAAIRHARSAVPEMSCREVADLGSMSTVASRELAARVQSPSSRRMNGGGTGSMHP